MLIVDKRRAAAGSAALTLSLPFELRQKTRLRTVLTNGEEVGLFLPRGSVLRDGECLEAADGRVIRVVAADEALTEAGCADAALLARVAYHLGNRHVPVQVGPGWLRFAADPVIAAMVRGLGASLRDVVAPFEPEGGAYGGGAHQHTGEALHRGVIHDFAGPPATDA
ncbi:MAG: urease accessory protein UreE [Betaproteobacteria bacterium]|nr:urease accessory protein UreE [Betaproteobacteria bacterium]